MIDRRTNRYPRPLLALSAAALLTLGLAACGGGEDEYGAYDEAGTEDYAATEGYETDETLGEDAGYGTEGAMGEGARADGAMAGDGEALVIATVNQDPQAWIDRSVQGEVEVSDRELTDRGFWVEQDGEEMFALVIDEPEERPIHIEKGQRLRLSEATLTDADQAGQLPGDQLDQDTQQILEQQEVFLLVDQDSIEILGQDGQAQGQGTGRGA